MCCSAGHSGCRSQASRTCPWCGSPLGDRARRAVFCSDQCQKAYGHHRCTRDEWLAGIGAELTPSGLYRRTCRWCGEPFETQNPLKRNCSDSCGKMLSKHGGRSMAEVRAETARTETRACAWCGCSFETSSPSKAYCCDRCRNMAGKHRGMTEAEYLAGRGTRVASSWRRPLKTRKCAWCGKEYAAKRADSCCCSPSCSVKYRVHGMSEAERMTALGALHDPAGGYLIPCPECGAMVRSGRLVARKCAACSAEPVVMEVRACRWCGEEFETRGGHKRFCSERCQKAYSHHGCSKADWLASSGLSEVRPGIYLRTCQWCGREFETTNPTKRNCSTTCGKYLARSGRMSREEWRADVERRKHKVCLWCGREFRADVTQAVYCSKACAANYITYGCGRDEARERRLAVCQWCGTAFVASRRGVQFCCGSHRDAFSRWNTCMEHRVHEVRNRLMWHECAVCGTAFRCLDDDETCCPSCSFLGLGSFRREFPFEEFRLSMRAERTVAAADRRAHAEMQARYTLLWGQVRCRVCGGYVRTPRLGAAIQVCDDCFDVLSPEQRDAVTGESERSRLVYLGDRPRAHVEVGGVSTCDAGAVKNARRRMERAFDPDAVRRRDRLYYAAHREEVLARDRKYRLSHPEEYRERYRKAYLKRTRDKVGRAALARYERRRCDEFYDTVVMMRSVCLSGGQELMDTYVSWRASYMGVKRLYLAVMRGELSSADFYRMTTESSVSAAISEPTRHVRAYSAAREREIRRMELLAIRNHEREQRRAVEKARSELYRRFRSIRLSLFKVWRDINGLSLAKCGELGYSVVMACFSEWYDRRKARERELNEVFAPVMARMRAERNAERKRTYEAEHREERLRQRRERFVKLRLARIEEVRRREDEQMRGYLEELASTRRRFAAVERVLRLPVEQRWEFAKDWTSEERAYAASVTAQTTGSAIELIDDDSGAALDMGAFDD